VQALGVVAEVALEGRRRKCERGLHLCEKSKIKMYKFHVLKCKINLFTCSLLSPRTHLILRAVHRDHVPRLLHHQLINRQLCHLLLQRLHKHLLALAALAGVMPK